MNVFSRITLRNLRKNKTRTLVTIIGIILSTAMFSAVTFTVSSLQHFLTEYEIYRYGSWHAQGSGVNEETLDALRQSDEIDDMVTLKLSGFAELEDVRNEDKPYLCVQEMSENFADMMPVHLVQGRMPQNSSEIILPQHLEMGGGIKYELNERITLSLGDRMSGGFILDNMSSYSPETEEETLENLRTREYTVVGFYQRPTFEEYYAPGYTALTLENQADSEEKNATFMVYMTLKNAEDTAHFIGTQKLIDEWAINYGLLRTTGASGEDSYNRVMYSLGAILIGIILFGSVSLIHNAFSISLNERTKQFGILTSVGATGRQLVRSVLTEGVFLAVIGIPLGILAGLLGMGITFRYLGAAFAGLVTGGAAIPLTLHPSLPATLIAVLISLFTIFVSAYLPARRASRRPVIEAIRQNSDVKIRPQRLKTSRMGGKLFGFEGTIAAKNYKRNRRKYRATVFSLFISVVLFISASSFGAYLERSMGYIYEADAYDIEMIYHPERSTGIGIKGIEQAIRSAEGVERVSYYMGFDYEDVGADKDDLTETCIERELYGAVEEGQPVVPDELLLSAHLVFVEDTHFKEYLTRLGLDEEEYFNPKEVRAVVVDNLLMYNVAEEKYFVSRVFVHTKDISLTWHPRRNLHQMGYDGRGYSLSDSGEYEYWYALTDMQGDDTPGGEEIDYNALDEDGILYNEGEQLIKLSQQEATASVPIVCGAVADEGPELAMSSRGQIVLYMPYSQLHNLLGFYIEEYEEKEKETGEDTYLYNSLPLLPVEDYLTHRYAIVSSDHEQTTAKLREWMQNENVVGFVTDFAEQQEENKTMLLVVRVFSYGFIILISLIAAANVFNTISTNVSLRRREFAMLKSVGMTPGGFNKMMVYECLLYGMKGLLYGLPVSAGVTWLIYRAVQEGLHMRFFIPWYSVVIAVSSVFIVVSASMIYAVNKLKDKNTIDELKNENL